MSNFKTLFLIFISILLSSQITAQQIDVGIIGGLNFSTIESDLFQEIVEHDHTIVSETVIGFGGIIDLKVIQ